jgi:hypothetical protein
MLVSFSAVRFAGAQPKSIASVTISKTRIEIKCTKGLVVSGSPKYDATDVITLAVASSEDGFSVTRTYSVSPDLAKRLDSSRPIKVWRQEILIPVSDPSGRVKSVRLSPKRTVTQ